MRPPTFEEWLERRAKKRASRRRWRTSHFLEESERKQRYREKYREKVRARRLAYEALMKGRLVKPVMCVSCGKRPVEESHHEDYTKPLEVLWLCRTCHNYYDRKKRGEV